MVEDSEKTLLVMRFAECLSDMKFDNQFLRREEVAVADPGTNEWIWSHPTFISWAQKSSGILWIEGKAGSGKSVLAKTIRSKLGQTGHFGTPGVPLPPISDWFYSTRHDSIARSHLSFLRSILSQILEQNKSSFQQYASIYRQKKENQESWTIEDYEQVLTGLAEMGVPAVSIVDAMDESDDGDGDFELRSRVIALMATLCLEAKSQLRFVVTSRYTADINRSFRKLSQNEGLLAHIVIERENWRDIQTIVENGLSKVRTALELFESDDDEAMDVPISHFQQNSETEVLSRMRQYLVDNADGVILWVNLSTQALADRVRRGFYNLKKLESELESLPQDLFDFYRLSLSELEHRYSPEDLSKTRLALMWVVGTNSIRPLALEELYEALSIDFATTSLIPAGLDPIANNPLRIHAKSWLGFYRQLRLRCGPFLEILAPQTQGYTPSFPESTEIKPHFTVQLIHRTVKEFLHNPEVSSILSFSEQEAEEMVQQSMRSYLNLVLPSSETAYCPIPARPGQDLDGIVRSMSEYLDKKYLLNFVLINLPEEEVLSHLAILELSVHPSLIQQKDYWPWNDALEDIATRYLKFACENSLARTITIQLTIASILLLSWPTLLRYGPLAVALKKCSAQYSTSREQPDSTSSKSDPKQKEITEAIDMLISFSSREQNLEWDAFGVGERRGPRGPSVPDSHVLSDLIVAVELFQGKRMKKKVAPKRPADDAETRDRVHTVQSADPFRLLAPWPPPTDEELTAMSQFLADDDDSAATPRIIYGTGLLGLDLDLYSGSTQTPDLLCEDTIMEDAPP
ncbi:hypothetical protein BJ166DRAFT_269833 [Pestalotiopsis sp. NC0098]|nr:hypothetical protein BJ166DRAFT_269833 [Pestalotiopsis sp. NC0098]